MVGTGGVWPLLGRRTGSGSVHLKLVPHYACKVLPHQHRGFLVPGQFQENQELHMLLGLPIIAVSVLHRPIDKQASHAVHAPQRFDEERVAGSGDRRLVE